MNVYEVGQRVREPKSGAQYVIQSIPGGVSLGLKAEPAYVCRGDQGEVLVVGKREFERARFEPVSKVIDLIPLTLSWLKSREVVVNGYGVFQVPKHINRVESRDGRTRGWQIRVNREGAYFSKLFSDSLYGNMTPRASLIAAMDYLDAMRLEPYVKEYPNMPGSEWNFGVGIRLVTRKRNRDGRLDYYLEVSAIDPALHSPKRFYVATESTLSKEKFFAPLSKARVHRAKMKAELLAIRKEEHAKRLQALRSL